MRAEHSGGARILPAPLAGEHLDLREESIVLYYYVHSVGYVLGARQP